MTLELTQTEDIAANLGRMKKPGQVLVGFALETDNELENAFKKLKSKNFDLIVLNSLNDPGAAFGKDTNKVTIIDSQNRKKDFSLKPKVEVAKDIVQAIVDFFSA